MIDPSLPEIRALDGPDFARFAQSLLGEGLGLRFRARGGSMRPLIRDGDLLEIRPLDSRRLKVGDVALVARPGGPLIAHRLVRLSARGGCVFQGDSASCPDPLVQPEWVLGQVVAVERGGRRFSVQPPPFWMEFLPIWRGGVRWVRRLKRRPFFSLLVFICLVATTFWPGFTPAAQAQSGGPSILSASATEILLQLISPSPILQDQGVCQAVTSTPGWSSTEDPGQPRLPFKGALLGVPPGAQPALDLVEAQVQVLPDVNNICRSPGQAAAQDPPPTGTYPAAPFQSGETAWLRDQQVYQVRFLPYQYDPSRRELRVYRRLTLRVRLNAPPGEQGSSPAPASSPVEDLFRSSLLNYEQARAWRAAPAAQVSGSTPTVLPASQAQAYKVQVNADGLYSLSYSDLSQAGIPVGSLDPRTLHLYYQGQEVALDVPGSADGRFDLADRLIFYGEKNLSRYSDTNVYWLTWDQKPGLRMAWVDAAPGATPPPPRATFRYSQRVEDKNTYYLSSRPSVVDGDHWYWDLLYARNATPVSRDYTFTLTNLVDTGAQARFRADLIGLVAAPQHHSQVYLNGTLLEDAFWPTLAEHVLDGNIPANLLLEGVNTVRVVLPLDGGLATDLVYLNWFEVTCDHATTAQEDRLLFTAGAGAASYSLGGFDTSDLAVYDVSTPRTPVRLLNPVISGVPGAYTLSFQRTSGSSGRFAAAAAEAFLKPLSITLDTPSTLHSPAQGADYLMIAPAAFLNALQPLVDYHQARGLSVQRVDVQDIYDEFSGGNFDPQAIHDFLAYAYSSWPAPAPVYVLLVGDGNFDFKDYKGTHEPNFIPPYLASVDPWMVETAADNRYVTVSGSDNLPDLFLGRLPVRSASELTALVKKILAYATTPPEGAWNAGVLFIADAKDTENDFPANSDVVADHLVPAPYQVSKVYLNQPYTPADARAAILSAINTGQLLVNYTGHASIEYWSQQNLFGKSNVPGLTNAGRLPFFTSMDCLEGHFAYPSPSGSDYSALAETLVRAPSGGAIATFSPTGMGVVSGHDLLDQGLYQAIFVDGVTRLGPAVTQAKLFLAQNGALHSELLDTYMLFGDPALHLNLVDQADLSLSLDLLPPGPATAGQHVTYRINYANQGARTAAQVRILHTLPITLSGATFVYTDPAVQPENSGWSLPDMSPGTSGSITVQAVVAPGFHGTLSLAAQALTETVETHFGDNAAALNVEVVLPVVKIFLPMLVNK